VRADRVLGRDRRAQLRLLGQRQRRDRVEVAGLARVADPELVAVERRPVEQVGDLLAVRRRVAHRW
jgi:hypothetical protein